MHTLRSIACVNADIIERQVGRPHMGSVMPLPKPHGDRKLFPPKDFCNVLFSNESKPHFSLNHLSPATPYVQLRRGNRDPRPSNCCHHTTPIGILAEQGGLYQVR